MRAASPGQRARPAGQSSKPAPSGVRLQRGALPGTNRGAQGTPRRGAPGTNRGAAGTNRGTSRGAAVTGSPEARSRRRGNKDEVEVPETSSARAERKAETRRQAAKEKEKRVKEQYAQRRAVQHTAFFSASPPPAPRARVCCTHEPATTWNAHRPCTHKPCCKAAALYLSAAARACWQAVAGARNALRHAAASSLPSPCRTARRAAAQRRPGRSRAGVWTQRTLPRASAASCCCGACVCVRDVCVERARTYVHA
jgi:hypothetical protein